MKKQILIHPIFFITLSFGTGLASAWFKTIAWLALCMGLCSGVAFFTKKISRPLFIAILLVLSSYTAGYIWYTWRHTAWHARACAYEKKSIGCVGIIKDYRHDPEKDEHIYTLQSLTIKQRGTNALQRCVYLKAKKKITGEVGDLVSLSGLYVGPLFSESFSQYLARHGIDIFAKATSYTKSYCIVPRYAPWYYYKNCAKEWVYTTVQQGSSRLQNLFALLFMGESTPAYKSDFQQWGAQHIAARSGVHFNIIAHIISIIIGLLPINVFLQCILLIISSLLYALSSGYSIAFLRALLVFILTCAAYLLRRIPDMIAILSITTLIILLWNPWYLMSLDFQLSFGITLILILALHNSCL